jgi:serine/threonine-protein kinase
MDDRRVIEIARAALRRPPEDRASFLDATCLSEAMRQEVESILAADAAASEEQFLDKPPLDERLLFDRHDQGAPSLDAWVGRQIGAYTIEKEIGAGGMGIVYGARDARLKRRVALKALPTTWRDQDIAQERFLREAQAASALDHPNICTIYAIDETEEGALYIAMAWYEGQTLLDRLHETPMPIAESVDILRQTATGLAAAHAAGITHRDIKPSNLFITDDGVVKILDFGIAKLEGRRDLTGEGRVVGTAAYMAPEQARGEAVSARADVWALGVVAYEILTGTHPFRRDTPAATQHALQYDVPRALQSARAEVPPALGRLVQQMLAKAPNERPAIDMVLAALDENARPAPVRAQSPRRTAWWSMGGVSMLAVVLLAIMTLGDFGFTPADHHSIAVLPLVNHAVDPALAPFAEGMTDALIADLGQIDGLRVISRTSTQAYSGTDKSLPEIADELGVSTIVEGAVQADGEQVGITVQLVDAANDRILWSNSYERPLQRIVSLQHEVALAIAREIEASVSPGAEQHLATAPEVHPEAYKHFLWGLYYRNHETLDAWRESARWLQRSIGVDASFAPAHALLAEVLVLSPDSTQVEAGRRAAERALALDPTLAGAHVALGLYREMAAWDWTAAEQSFRRAVSLAPGDAAAHHELGLLLMRQRRFEEALPFVQRAMYLDPLSARMQNGVAAVHLFAGQYITALDGLQQSLTLESENAATYWRLGQAYQGLGRHDDAITAFERMLALGFKQAAGHLGHALAVAGRREEAQTQADTLAARYTSAEATEGAWLAYNLALVHTGLGNEDTALTWLERAHERRSLLLVYLDVVPAFDPLRSHPRFQILRGAVGFDTRPRASTMMQRQQPAA